MSHRTAEALEAWDLAEQTLVRARLALLVAHTKPNAAIAREIHELRQRLAGIHLPNPPRTQKPRLINP